MGAPKEILTPGEFKYELCDLSALYTYNGWMPQYFMLSCDCSLFCSKSFCLPCVKENLNAFPLEIKGDKRKPQQKSCKKTDTKHKS